MHTSLKGNIVIVGAQWGDEGKGKITNLLAENAALVCRYAGGNNAGHTVVMGKKTFRLHQIPSGIFYPATLCVMGSGMVINLESLLEEIDSLEGQGVSTENLRIAQNAHVIMDYHILADRSREDSMGKAKIGTTGRGIGPAYMDKAARSGIRIIDLFEEDLLREKISYHLGEKAKFLEGSGLTVETVFNKTRAQAERIRPLAADTPVIINQALKAGKKILFEGAQGALLDLDFGTYPYVTSSSAISGGASTGLGVPPFALGNIIGISKAYTTRVGSGPFPTELLDETGEHLRETGREYGTTTGRPRRCGWLDAVVLRHAAVVNGLTSLAVTKLDVLSGMHPLKIASAYRAGAEEISSFPYSQTTFSRCLPVYEEMPGWEGDISFARSWNELPQAARNFLSRIEELCGVPIGIISVGPEKDETLIR
ncbi:MAG: adenylosuccinate synthase [bacterium]